MINPVHRERQEKSGKFASATPTTSTPAWPGRSASPDHLADFGGGEDGQSCCRPLGCPAIVMRSEDALRCNLAGRSGSTGDKLLRGCGHSVELFFDQHSIGLQLCVTQILWNVDGLGGNASGPAPRHRQGEVVPAPQTPAAAGDAER